MKVGDYVRTKYGVIAKITDILEDCSIDCDIDVYYEGGLKDDMPMMEIPYDIKDEYIIKSDSEPIELVQVGDYVNGYKISNIIHYADMGTCLESEFIDSSNYGNKYIKCFGKKQIESIVTKEQFSQIEYKVGE